MYENDYIMRMIHDMIRALGKVIFHKDIDEWKEVSFRDEESGKLFSELDGMLYRMELKEAQALLENRLNIENLENLKVALLFYDRLNQLEDKELEEHGISREELEEQLRGIMEKFGYGELGGMLI